MNIQFLDLKKNYLSIKNEIDAEYNNLFNNCDFIHGEKVKIFEENFAKYLNINHFIGCANGTDALEIAIKSLNLNDNDEIIVQGNTYIATCLGVLNNNLKLVLCDIEPSTHMIDLNKLKQKITNNTKVLIIVHLYGLMPNMNEVMNICKENKLYLIEDCAQAHGASWNEQKAGTFGDLSCFSFYPGKNLGAFGDGGGIATDNDELNEKIRKIANLGCKIKYHHELIGRNSRLDTIQASFLNIKLKYLDKWNEARRKNAEIYNINLSDIDNIETPNVIDLCKPVYHLYVIKTNYRDELKKYLENKNITCLIHYPISIAETEAMSLYNYTDVDECINNSKKILSLPMYPELEENEILYVCNNIKKFFLENNLLSLKSIKTNKPGILNCVNNIEFNLKRFFYIDNLLDYSINKKRGFHANLNFNEIFFVIQGKVSIKLIDKNLNETINIINKNNIFYIPKIKWIEYEILVENTIIMVFVDEILSKSKSIFNIEEFINYSI
jgi:dTDP-4-amino-4,6-dideoxygalactose transaminase